MSAPTAREAGREMDAEVAEKVLGWKRGRRWGNGNGEWIEPGREDAPHKRTWDTTPHFSTDFAAAWEVVEKLSPDLPFEMVDVGSFNPESPDLDRWGCSFGEESSGSAPTAPLAICRAALLALASRAAAAGPTPNQE